MSDTEMLARAMYAHSHVNDSYAVRWDKLPPRARAWWCAKADLTFGARALAARQPDKEGEG